MTVLVTGATGFIGSEVCRELQNRGLTVRAAVRRGSERSRIASLLGEAQCVEYDLFAATESELAAICRGIDVCIHCAWYAVPGQYLSAAENILCREGSLRLFAALRAAGCRRIAGVGTCFEYGSAHERLTETAALGPATLYAREKLRTFQTGQELDGIDFAWARVFHLYGPFEDPRRLVPDVVLGLLRGQRVATTRGIQVRDFLHVTDVAAALVAIAMSELSGAVNVGSGVPVTVRQVVETIGELIGGLDLLDIGARPDRAGDPEFICADNTLLRTATDWRPRFDLQSGLRDTIDWWRENA